MGVNIEPERFEQLVQRAFDALPKSLQLENLPILIDEEQLKPTGKPNEFIAGEYFGCTHKNLGWHECAVAKRVVVYKKAVELGAHNEKEVLASLVTLLAHEIGHALGFDEQKLRELGVTLVP